MSATDPGIHRPFDRIAKSFAGEAPRILFDLLGMRGAEIAGVRQLRPESAPPSVLPDAVVRVEPVVGRPYILHLEFEVDFKRAELATIARQGGSLAFQHSMRVDSVAFLLAKGRAPRKIPRIARAEVEGTRLTHPFRVVRSWELDPGPVLRSGLPGVMAWAVVLRTTDGEVARLADFLKATGDREAIVRFLILGSLRYDRNRLERMLGGVAVSFEEAILEGSSLFREAREKYERASRAEVRRAKQRLKNEFMRREAQVLEEGLAKGLEQGLEQGLERGRGEAGRLALREVLRNLHPGLETLREIDSIDDASLLSALLRQACSSRDRAGLARAIRKAAARKARHENGSRG